MTARTYLSIGDVLSLLREEFPDVTISKIRFLESQRLVNPERSPSGYRKFYEPDVERLRWVLRQQRDHFLPLKVIRDRLARAGKGVPEDEPTVSPHSLADDPAGGDGEAVVAPVERPDAGRPAIATRVAASVTATQLAPESSTGNGATVHVGGPVPPAGVAGAPRTSAGGEVTSGQGASGTVPSPEWAGPERPVAPATTTSPGPEAAADAGEVADAAGGGARRRPAAPRPAAGAGGDAPGSEGAATGPGPAEARDHGDGGTPEPKPEVESPPPAHASTEPPPPGGHVPAHAAPDAGPAVDSRGQEDELAADEPRAPGDSLTLDELCAVAGLPAAEIAALERFGLIEPVTVAGVHYYDNEAVTVATVAAELGRYGIEPRHLRIFRNAVDREVGLVEQVVAPLLRQRNPSARQRAVESAHELARLGERLRSSLLRRELRRQLGR